MVEMLQGSKPGIAHLLGDSTKYALTFRRNDGQFETVLFDIKQLQEIYSSSSVQLQSSQFAEVGA